MVIYGFTQKQKIQENRRRCKTHNCQGTNKNKPFKTNQKILQQKTARVNHIHIQNAFLEQ